MIFLPLVSIILYTAVIIMWLTGIVLCPKGENLSLHQQLHLQHKIPLLYNSLQTEESTPFH